MTASVLREPIALCKTLKELSKKTKKMKMTYSYISEKTVAMIGNLR